jgi:dienelactone hydrolase
MAIYGMGPTMLLNTPGRTYPGVRDWFKALRLAEGATMPIGATGYCWGGKHVVTMASFKDKGGPNNDKPLFDAGFTAHPSMLSIPKEIEEINLPVSFALAELDMGMSVDQEKQIKKIIEAKEGSAKGEAKIYEGVGHGFSVRADFKVEKVAMQAAEAEHQALDWFNKHFGF